MDILPGLTGKPGMNQGRLAMSDGIADDGIKVTHGRSWCQS
jgi:hypothetical protein